MSCFHTNPEISSQRSWEKCHPTRPLKRRPRDFYHSRLAFLKNKTRQKVTLKPSRFFSSRHPWGFFRQKCKNVTNSVRTFCLRQIALDFWLTPGRRRELQNEGHGGKGIMDSAGLAQGHKNMVNLTPTVTIECIYIP